MGSLSSAALPDHFLEKMYPDARKALGKAGVTIAEAFQKAEIQAEKDLHRQVVAYLEQHHGIKVGHAAMNRKSTYTVGWPDLTFCYHEKPCALELKVGKNKLEPEQEVCIKAMHADGWNVAVVRSLEEVKAFLERMKL